MPRNIEMIRFSSENEAKSTKISVLSVSQGLTGW